MRLDHPSARELLLDSEGRSSDAAATGAADVAPAVDWGEVLSALDRGDPVAIARVSRVVSGFLNRYRAYELRDCWEDLRQEVLEILIRTQRSGALRHTGAFVAYTGRVVWSRLALRARGKKLPIPLPPIISTALDPELALDLERALEALPERERAVVDAIYLRGVSYQSAAEQLQLPLGTLKRLQTAALQALRESLGVSRRARPTSVRPADASGESAK